MMFQKKERIFSIPMMASMLLLPCFLAYFLKSEFDKEKRAIISEKRESAFENLFLKIDTISKLPQHKNLPGSVKWVKEGFETDSSYKYELKYVVDFTDSIGNNLQHIDKFISLNADTEINAISSSIENSLFSGKKDTISFTSRGVASAEEIVINSMDLESDDSKIHSSKMNGNMTILQVTDSASKPSFVISSLDVATIEILNGIYPQIFLSIFLLGSVWLSFYLSAQSIKRERQLTVLRNDFMSNMSHELKTPVSTISVALEALRNFDAANDANLRKEYIDISKSEVDRLGLLVDKALNISLYEQGKFVYEKQIVDLDIEINRILKTLKIQLDNQNVSLQYHKSGNRFFVNVDKTHIINVIHNLIENGIKYSDAPAQINIEMLETPDIITVKVGDKGCGIPKEYHEKIFDKFFRVPKGNTHNIKGHGLGLSYVKEVVQSQGGKISVTSDIDQGSIFVISLPKVDTE